MNAFKVSCLVEARSRKILEPFLETASDGRYVFTEKGLLAKELQQTYGDIFTTIHDRLFAVEVKAEEKKTGNFFIEFMSNSNVQAPDGVNPGWVLKLRADLLFYHILDCDELYILPFRWMQHAVINGFTDIGVKPLVQTCKLVPQRKAAQKNLTTGLLVGIELLDSLSKKTRCGRPITKVNPLGLFADEEKEVALTGNRVP